MLVSGWVLDPEPPHGSFHSNLVGLWILFWVWARPVGGSGWTGSFSHNVSAGDRILTSDSPEPNPKSSQWLHTRHSCDTVWTSSLEIEGPRSTYRTESCKYLSSPSQVLQKLGKADETRDAAFEEMVANFNKQMVGTLFEFLIGFCCSEPRFKQVCSFIHRQKEPNCRKTWKPTWQPWKVRLNTPFLSTELLKLS